MQGKYVSVEKYCTADLLQNNRLLSIYPIRPKTSTTAELDSTTTTARPFPNEDDLFSEDYFEDRAEQTFPRWQNFPFSAESIQVILQLNFLKDQSFHWNFCCQNGIPELLTKNNLATFHAWPQTTFCETTCHATSTSQHNLVNMCIALGKLGSKQTFNYPTHVDNVIRDFRWLLENKLIRALY